MSEQARKRQTELSHETSAKARLKLLRPVEIPANVIGYGGQKKVNFGENPVDIYTAKLLSLSVLENEKKELVEYLTARFGVQPETAAQIYNQISPNFNREASTRPPEIAPELYADRRNRNEKAPAFLTRVYGQWLGDNPSLFQPAVRRLDPALVQGLVNSFRGKSGCVEDVLPTKSKEVDARLGGGSVSMTPEERKRQLTSQYSLVRR